ncbi:MAG: hypothetical protein PHF31_14965 [Methylobacter sp.]|nr:hypothetical protein [Methylobacter sp.]
MAFQHGNISALSFVFRGLQEDCHTLSCHQPIASDSAFSLAMIEEFSNTITEKPWLYRRLFWECGLIGQVLYLEAEACKHPRPRYRLLF